MDNQPVLGEDALAQWGGSPLIAVWGLGKLGLPLCTVLAGAGFSVRGIDNNKDRVEQVRQSQGVARAHGILFEDLDLDQDELSFHDEGVAAPINFVVVPTPSNADGSFSSLAVEKVIEDIQQANMITSSSVIIVIVSTVSPGTCERIANGLGSLYTLLYNPTFIALDSVVHDLTRPRLLFAGYGGWPYDVQVVWHVWKKVFEAYEYDFENLTCLQASFVEIELLKLSVNAALGTKIALANSLGQLFKAYGADPKIVHILEDDPRLGIGYLTPGGPISGPCLPRDNAALRAAGHKFNVRLPISEATDEIDLDLRRQVLYDICRPTIPKTVGILGMSYKYGVDVTTGSMGEWLRENLNGLRGVNLSIWDDHVTVTNPLNEVLAAEVIVVTQVEYETMLKHASPKGRIIRIW